MRMQDVWSEGDRVLAPWEADWLYPGTIRCIDEEVAFIRFDDGDRALVPLLELEPIELEAGDEVYGRVNREERRYFPARVLEARQEDLWIRYDDDGSEERTTVSFVRVPRRAIRPQRLPN